LAAVNDFPVRHGHDPVRTSDLPAPLDHFPAPLTRFRVARAHFRAPSSRFRVRLAEVSNRGGRQESAFFSVAGNAEAFHSRLALISPFPANTTIPSIFLDPQRWILYVTVSSQEAGEPGCHPSGETRHNTNPPGS